MDWEQVKNELERLLDMRFAYGHIPLKEWKRLSDPTGGEFVTIDSTTHFYLQPEHDETLQTLAINEALLTRTEKRLIAMALTAHRSSREKWQFFRRRDDGKFAELREWINDHLEAGNIAAELPECYRSVSAFYASKVPLLLVVGESEQKHAKSESLPALLESYFAAEVTIIPLKDMEWLILGPPEIIDASDETDANPGEELLRLEESLQELAQGLYEMMISEWGEDCHVAVSYPFVPAKKLLSVIAELRESISLGKSFHLGANVHLPWKLVLDRLLNAVPEREKERYIERVWKNLDHVLDSEMLKTLEQFFELNCNVSETAKTLYIHRNTLLYRLDRLKQEIGMDVRIFSDAVLVKLALMLIKAAKHTV
ncbi:MAG TPA: helix-turn-helix domain-containing protein [Bacilli bacterium]